MNGSQTHIDFPTHKIALSACICVIFNRDNITCLTITKCSSPNDATQLLAQEWFRQVILNDFPALIAIRLQVDGDVEALPDWQPRICEFEGKLRFLIVLESTQANTKLIYWRNEESNIFFKLELVDRKLSAKLKDYVVNFILDGLMEENGSVTTRGSSVVTLTTLWHASGNNLMLTAIFDDDLPMVQELLQHPFDVNMNLWIQAEDEDQESTIKRPIDFAWDHAHQDVVLTLLKAGSTYPKNFVKAEASKAVRDFLNISERLHNSIRDEKSNEILSIIERNRKQRFFFNSNNVSAMHAALRSRETAFVEMMIENNLSFGPDEDVKGGLNTLFGDRVRKLHSKYANRLPCRHIMLLLSKSVIPRCDKNLSRASQLIKNALARLDSHNLVQPVLEVLATNVRLKFHYDFAQFSVVYMDPTRSRYTRGVYTPYDKHILVACANLLNEDTQNEADAIMAHEFFHGGLDDVFRNERLPFPKGDEKSRVRWEKIVSECQKVAAAEYIVASVFENYKENGWGRELAVRVPHMLAHYRDNSEKLKELEVTFKSLFEYHEKVVVKEMKLAVSVLEKLANNSLEIRYDELTEPLKAALRHTEVNFQGEFVELRLITNIQMLNKLTSQQIRQILDENGEIFKIDKSPVALKREGDRVAYVERKFIKNDQIKGIEDVSSGESRLFLLSDKAGEGKSTSMRYLSMTLKAEKPNFWVSYIDLKRHMDIYKTYVKTKKPFLKLLLKILALDEGSLESAIFENLLRVSRVIFFLDGFDEIAPRYKELVLGLVKAIKRSTVSQLWISTRPQHTRELEDQLKCKSHKFLPFDEAEVDRFIECVLRSQGVSDESTLQLMTKKVNEARRKLRPFPSDSLMAKQHPTSITQLTSESVDNPLMLKMMAELAAGDKLPSTSLNHYDLYEEMIRQKWDILFEAKGSVATRDTQNDSKITPIEVHQVYALQTILKGGAIGDYLNAADFLRPKQHIRLQELELLQKWKHERSKWSPEKISRLGLLIIDEWGGESERPDFVHRTFAEFFVAKFLIESLTQALAIEEEQNKDENQLVARMRTPVNAFYTICFQHRSDFLVNFLGGFLHRERRAQLGKETLRLLARPKLRRLMIFNFRSEGLMAAVLASARYCFGNFKTLFQVFFSNGLWPHCFELLDIFRHSEVKNWHRHTGFGKGINSSQLLMPRDDELSQLTDEFSTLFAGEEASSEEKRELKIAYQCVCFMTSVNDIPLEYVINFVNVNTHELALLILGSTEMLDKLITLIEKNALRMETLFLNVLLRVSEIFLTNVRKNVSERLKKNFGHFLKQSEKLNETQLKKLFGFCGAKLLYPAILLDVESVTEFYRKYFSVEEICEALARGLPEEVKMAVDELHLERFDRFIRSISEFECAFKFFFNTSSFRVVSEYTEILRRVFDDQRWINCLGYTHMKDSQIISESHIEEISHAFDGAERSEIIMRCNVANALLSCDIPKSDFERFVAKNENILFNPATLQDHNFAGVVCFVLLRHISSENFNNNQNMTFFADFEIVYELMSEGVLLNFGSLSKIRLMSIEDHLEDSEENGNFLKSVVRLSEESEEDFQKARNLSLLFYHFLNLIDRKFDENSNFNNFFVTKMKTFSRCIFRSHLLVENLFKVAQRIFVEPTEATFDFFSSFLKTDFLSPSRNKKLSSECRANVELFWKRIGKFFKPCFMLQRFLMCDDTEHHPLFYAIHHGIKRISKFYIQHMKVGQILSILVYNPLAIDIYFSRERFSKFFTELFLKDEARRVKMRRFLHSLKLEDVHTEKAKLFYNYLAELKNTKLREKALKRWKNSIIAILKNLRNHVVSKKFIRHLTRRVLLKLKILMAVPGKLGKVFRKRPLKGHMHRTLSGMNVLAVVK